MAFLGDTPFLETASPFATPPTVIRTAAGKIEEAVYIGVGIAVGTVIAAWLFKTLFSIKIAG